MIFFEVGSIRDAGITFPAKGWRVTTLFVDLGRPGIVNGTQAPSVFRACEKSPVRCAPAGRVSITESGLMVRQPS